MEGDHKGDNAFDFTILFQSTPSAWRATYPRESNLLYSRFQSTPSAWRATALYSLIVTAQRFQSTPSAWRATAHYKSRHLGGVDFNPRPPRGGRHHTVFVNDNRNLISIHALRVEGDTLCCLARCQYLRHFNPRPPRGGRQQICTNIKSE